MSREFELYGDDGEPLSSALAPGRWYTRSLGIIGFLELERTNWEPVDLPYNQPIVEFNQYKGTHSWSSFWGGRER